MSRMNQQGARTSLLAIVLCFLIAVSAIVGFNFERMRVFVTQDEDVTFYRDILQYTYPLFKMGFDHGNFRFSLLEEMNEFMLETIDLNFVNPETFLKHRLSLMEIFSKDQEWLTLQISKGNAHGENPQQGGYLSSESSLEYEPEHGADETWAEKNGNLHFIKEWNVSFDAMALLAKPFNLNSNKKGPKVLIYHTHPSEAYMPSSELMTANSLAPIGKVNQVGERIASGLQKKYGIEVIHNTTLHDRPELKYAYGKALTTVENILKSYPSIKVVLDIHRDGLAGVEKFRPTVQWQGKDFAKVMMVVGTNVTGLQHPQWTSNLTFAMHMQQKLEEMVPGITRPIYISKYRYNQHVANQAIIIEVGGDGNSMMEALASADILSQGIGSFFKK